MSEGRSSLFAEEIGALEAQLDGRMGQKIEERVSGLLSGPDVELKFLGESLDAKEVRAALTRLRSMSGLGQMFDGFLMRRGGRMGGIVGGVGIW